MDNVIALVVLIDTVFPIARVFVVRSAQLMPMEPRKLLPWAWYL